MLGLLATGLRQRFNQVLTPLFARLDYHGIAWPWSVDVISLPEERKHFDWALLATPALADLEPTFRRIQDHRSLMLHPVERFSPRLKNHAVWGDRQFAGAVTDVLWGSVRRCGVVCGDQAPLIAVHLPALTLPQR